MAIQVILKIKTVKNIKEALKKRINILYIGLRKTCMSQGLIWSYHHIWIFFDL